MYPFCNSIMNIKLSPFESWKLYILKELFKYWIFLNSLSYVTWTLRLYIICWKYANIIWEHYHILRKKISIFFFQGTKKEYFQIYDSFEKLTHNFRLLHLNLKPKPDTSCYVQNAALVAQPPGRWVKLYTHCCWLILFLEPICCHPLPCFQSKETCITSSDHILQKRKQYDIDTIWQEDE